MGEANEVNYSLLGLMGQTVDVMMQANTRVAMRSADIIINPPLKGFGSLDWRRSAALAADGYQAAEAMKDQLLPLAVDEATWNAYLSQRRARRRSDLPVPEFLSVVGATSSDQPRMELALAPHVGHAIDVDALEAALEAFAGLDRYETVDWQLIEQDGRAGLQVRARPKTYAPPFLMLGISLQNTTTSDFAFQLSGRFHAFDVAGSGSELRIDAAVGAQPRIGAELFRPIGRSGLFVAASAFAEKESLHFVDNDAVVAEYDQTRAVVGVHAGVTLGRDEEVRASLTTGSLTTSIAVGDPGLPELDGRETRARVAWSHDGQDSPVVPSSGVRAQAEIRHIFESPDVPASFVTNRSNTGLTQAEIVSSAFWPVRRRDQARGRGHVVRRRRWRTSSFNSAVRAPGARRSARSAGITTPSRQRGISKASAGCRTFSAAPRLSAAGSRTDRPSTISTPRSCGPTSAPAPCSIPSSGR
jgi:NTE family protein